MQDMYEKLPPGPRTSPAMQLARFIRAPHIFLEQCDREHGDSFTIRLLGQPPLVCTSDPEALKWILTQAEDDLSHANDIMRIVLGDRSMLFMNGAPHRRERRLMMPMFHGKRLRAYGEMMRDSARELIASWPRGEPFPVHPRVQALTLRIMARCVFGGIDSARLKRLCGVLARWLDETLSPFLCALSALVPPEHIDAGHGDEGGLGWIQKLRDKLLPWRLVNRHRVEIHQMVLDEIARCKRQGDVGREDILAMLCGARDEHGDPMSDDEIKDELLTLLIGGHETTAVTLTWALYHIMRNPGVGRRISEEARRAFGDGPIAPERVGELVYMDAVINEAMRLTPVGICFPRKLNRARRVGRHELPAGTILLINTYLSHRRPDVWERPTAFHPERFLGKKPDPTTFFPFGGGQRRCIGGEFARQEMKIILAQLFSSMSISEAANLEVRPRFRGVHFSPPADLSIALRPCREATAAACA